MFQHMRDRKGQGHALRVLTQWSKGGEVSLELHTDSCDGKTNHVGVKVLLTSAMSFQRAKRLTAECCTNPTSFGASSAGQLRGGSG